eukprot:68765-Karenia_brevis.AAC.1
MLQHHFGKSRCTSGDRLDLTSAFHKGCTSVSRWCLRAGQHCQLPSEVDGLPFHTTHHVAHATAEMCRPFPLGT